MFPSAIEVGRDRGRHRAESGVLRSSRSTTRVGPCTSRRRPTDRAVRIFLGGSSKPAARQRRRIADGFVPSVPDVWTYYRNEVQSWAGPIPALAPSVPNQVVALAEDPNGMGADGAVLLHENNAYGAWQAQSGVASPYQSVDDTDELRATAVPGPRPRGVRGRAEGVPSPYVTLHPMCGWYAGTSAWSSLRLFEAAVLRVQIERRQSGARLRRQELQIQTGQSTEINVGTSLAAGPGRTVMLLRQADLRGPIENALEADPGLRSAQRAPGQV